MSIASEYKIIFQREVATNANNLIRFYTPISDTHEFHPLSHNCTATCPRMCADTCHTKLGELMRKNLVYYCYGEDEIVQKTNSGLFTDLEKAAIYAYENRLPKRAFNQDGLPGEVLLDLLVQIHEPDAYKLAVRAILRQDDNNEIKGYDLTYFSVSNGNVSLWLGQAKMGSKDYCKRGIRSDLLEKFTQEYLSRQIYFLADKQAGITDEGKKITDAINALNMYTHGVNAKDRAKALVDYFARNSIYVYIPCLLAYGEGSVYTDKDSVVQAIDAELVQMRKYFLANNYLFDGFEPRIIFFIFPIKDLAKLRSKGGFYCGLR